MEEKLRLNFKLLDMVSDSIILLDVRGKMVYANKTAAKSRGYNLESFLELQMKDLYPKDKTNYVRKQLAEAIESGEKVFEVENLTKNGETRWFSVKVIPVKIDQDKYILKICRSIKEKQEIQKAEALAKEQSQKLLEGASRVTSMVRHDLRSPLQSIKNAVHIIRRTPSKTEEMLNVIDKAADYASKILSDLRFITNPGKVQREKFDMAELLEERIKSSIIPSSVKVIANLPESQDVNLDSTMISRVIDNLIRNAVEAMPKGGTLTINASVDGNILKIIVQDSGVGINEENKLNLFQPFYTTKRSGTGLGLYYSKLAVESHGGKMSFNSEEGIGTRFHLEIPLI